MRAAAAREKKRMRAREKILLIFEQRRGGGGFAWGRQRAEVAKEAPLKRDNENDESKRWIKRWIERWVEDKSWGVWGWVCVGWVAAACQGGAAGAEKRDN